MTVEGAGRLRFGDCELDLATRELWRSGEPVRLQPRVFGLLAYLIDQRHRAVDKDEIQDAVWTGVIVTETALTRAIMKARRAVGDSADQQAVIRTVHGHGYQFVADLQEAAAASTLATEVLEAPADGAVETSEMRIQRMRWLLGAVAAVMVVGLTVLLWPTPAPSNGVRVAVLPVHNASGDAELDWTRLGLMDFANQLFRGAAELEVVAASELVRFVEDTGWSGQLEAPDADERIGRLRQAFGASHVLVSELSQNAGGLRLTYTLIDPAGEHQQGTAVDAEGTELVRGMVHGVNAALTNKRRLRDRFPGVSEDPFINEAYARGMSFSLEGRCGDALPLFAVVYTKSDAIVQARIEWAKCAHILGQWQEAEEALQTVLAQLNDAQPSATRAAAYDVLGTLYLRTGRVDEAYATYEAGLAEARATGDENAQGQLLNSLAIVTKDRRDFPAARELLARATVAYREAGRSVLPGQIPAALANIAMYEGKLDQAHGHLEDALTSFRSVGDRRNEAMMLNNTGYLLRLQGRYTEAEPFHQQSLAIRREIGDRVGQGRILGMLSTLYEGSGRFEEARDAALEAVAIAREANDALFLATGLAQLGTAQHSLGDVGAARGAYEESRAMFGQIDDHSRVAQIELRLAGLDMDEEQLDAAAARVDLVLERALARELHEPAIEAYDYRGDLARRRLDADAARDAYRRALEHIDETGFTARRMSIATKLAHLYLDAEDLSSAEPLLGFVLEQDDTPATLKLQARYAFVKGDPQRSVRLMEAAKALAEESWTPTDSQTLAHYQQSL